MVSPGEENRQPPKGSLDQACLLSLLPERSPALMPQLQGPSPLHMPRSCLPWHPWGPCNASSPSHPKSPSERVQLSDSPHCHLQPQWLLHSNGTGRRAKGQEERSRVGVREEPGKGKGTKVWKSVGRGQLVAGSRVSLWLASGTGVIEHREGHPV